DEIDEQPEVKELKAVIFKGRVEAAAFTAIPYEKVVDRAAEEISTKDSKKAMEKEDSSPLKAEIKAELEIKKLKNDGMDKEMETEEIKLVVEEKIDEEDGKDEGDAEINDEKKKNSKENAKSKKSKNKSKKTDFIPLKVEVKSEPEMKEIMHNNKNEGMETKEEAPEAQEKVTEEVNKAAEEVEIKDEKKKNNSNKKSNSKNGEKKEIAVTPQIRKIPSKDIAEMQPVKNEVNADIVKRGIESAKCAAILAEKSFEKVGNKKVRAKEDSSPLKAKMNLEPEIKVLNPETMDKAKEPEELTPEVDENLTKDVIKSAKKYEIEDEKKKEKRSKKKSKSKKREEKSAKKKRGPLEKDVKAEIEIKELKEDIIKTAKDAKELTPVADDKMGDKVVKPKKVFEIEVDKKKKEKSKKYSKSKKSEKKEAEATPKKHKIPILVKEEVLPDVEELNLNDMETAKELSPAVEKNVHKKAAKVGKAKAKIKHHKEKKKQSKKSKNSKKG
ncbi:hypothetical protein D917_07747, partial [Trichinella nativa]